MSLQEHDLLATCEEKWFCSQCAPTDKFYDPFAEVFEFISAECITIEDDDSDVQLIKEDRTPSKILPILKQTDASEKLLSFHKYILSVTRTPIYENDEIYKNHPIRFNKV